MLIILIPARDDGKTSFVTCVGISICVISTSLDSGQTESTIFQH